MCFYQRESLPGYSAIFRHPNDELNYCYYLIPCGKDGMCGDVKASPSRVVLAMVLTAEGGGLAEQCADPAMLKVAPAAAIDHASRLHGFLLWEPTAASSWLRRCAISCTACSSQAGKPASARLCLQVDHAPALLASPTQPSCSSWAALASLLPAHPLAALRHRPHLRRISTGCTIDLMLPSCHAAVMRVGTRISLWRYLAQAGCQVDSQPHAERRIDLFIIYLLFICCLAQESDLKRLHEDAIKHDPFISQALGPKAKIERMKAAALRLGGQGLTTTFDEHLLIIGDAAGHIDPLTGEGIHTAMMVRSDSGFRSYGLGSRVYDGERGSCMQVSDAVLAGQA